MAIADGLAVLAVSLLAAAFVVPGLGFYSDDWVLVAAFRLAPDQGLIGLFNATHAQHFASRPVQGLYSILLYKAFGASPLGYHVVNAAVLAACAVLFGHALARLGWSRLAALGSALVFAATPAFSTDWFWFAAFAAPLSLLLYLVSLAIDLRVSAWQGWRLAAGRTASLAILATGLLAYELALPLAFFSPLLAWHRARLDGRRWGWRQWMAWGLPTVALLASISIYKAEDSGRLGSLAREPQRIAAIVTGLVAPGAKEGDYGLNLPRAFDVNFGDHGWRLPAHAWTLRRTMPGPALPVMALAALIGVAAYLRRVARDEPWRRGSWAALAIGGLAAFVTGYAVFVTNTAIQITPTGVGNRTSLAAALGLAMTIIGVTGFAASWLPRQARGLAVAAVLAIYAAAGLTTLAALSTYWRDAYPREQAVVADILAHVPAPSPKSTVFLAGVCPYHGPAIVFESSWDLAFALRLASGNAGWSADVVSSKFRPGAEAITTSLYDEEYDWPYGPSTLLYDFRRKTVTPLLDQRSARQALQEVRGALAGCPRGMEGVGAPVF